jgi:hypothetical protein
VSRKLGDIFAGVRVWIRKDRDDELIAAGKPGERGVAGLKGFGSADELARDPRGVGTADSNDSDTPAPWRCCNRNDGVGSGKRRKP